MPQTPSSPGSPGMPDDREPITMPSDRAPTTTRSMCIISHSIHHGNTNLVAKAIAEAFRESGWQAELLDIEEAAAADLSRYELVGFGSGIYFGRHHPEILRLPGQLNPAPKSVFIFSTAGLPFLKWIQHAALRRRLKRSGIPILGEHSARGWDTVGPLWLMAASTASTPTTATLSEPKPSPAS